MITGPLIIVDSIIPGYHMSVDSVTPSLPYHFRVGHFLDFNVDSIIPVHLIFVDPIIVDWVIQEDSIIVNLIIPRRLVTVDSIIMGNFFFTVHTRSFFGSLTL